MFKRTRTTLFGLFTLVFIITACTTTANTREGLVQAYQQPKEVLFISSYHPTFPTFDDQITGLETAFFGRNITIDVEFIDSKRFPQEEIFDNFEDHLTFKLEQLDPYDAIVVADDNAFLFALDHQQDLFQTIPIVFLGVNQAELALDQNQNPQMSGVIESIACIENIETMQHLQPGLEEIILITDGAPSMQGDVNCVYAAVETFPELALTELSLAEMSIEELDTKLLFLEFDQQAVLLIQAYRDNTGKVFSFQESLSFIRNSANVPIYHHWMHGIGSGILGGKVLSHVEQGKAAGQLVLQLFNGIPISDLPIIENTPNVYRFDQNEMTRFGLSMRDLPEGAAIINQKTSYVEENLPLFLSVSAIILAETTLVFYLILFNRKRKLALASLNKTHAQLVESDRFLSTVFEESPLIIILASLDGETVKVNQNFINAFQTPFEAIHFPKEINQQTEIQLVWQKYIDRARIEGRILEEMTFPMPDDTSRDFRVWINLVNIEGVEYLMGIAQDIALERKLEENIQQSQFAIDHSSIPVFLVEPTGRISYANQKACDELEYTRTELTAKSFWELPAPGTTGSDKERWLTGWVPFSKTHVYTTDGVFRTQTGKDFHVRVTSNHFTIGDKEFAWVFAHSIDERKAAEEAVIEANQQLETTYFETLQGWSKALELRDLETAGHTQRVTELCLQFARKLNFSESELESITRGAILHDIGKLGVPDHILLKPGKLTGAERQIIEQHPVHATNMLKDIPFLKEALDIPHYHHEHWDGSGYPEGLIGKDIPIAARIFAIVDVWDALRSQRPYHTPFTDQEARQFMLNLAGIHFDPVLLNIFFEEIIPPLNYPQS